MSDIKQSKRYELDEIRNDIINRLIKSGNKIESNDNKEDLRKLPKYRLLEMLNRQNKLLSNRLALEKLPDKGTKIKQSKKQIEDELEKRFPSEKKLTDFMASLSLTSSEINDLEWTRDLESLKKDKTNNESIEYDENPFRILATHSGTVLSKKIVKRVEEDEPLITDKDIEEIYAMKRCNKIDQIEPIKKFLPHKTLNKTFISKKSLEEYKPEDLSSAIEPPLKYGNLKIISLEDSIKIQREQFEHLKEIQLKHAAERLKLMTYKIGNELPSAEKLKLYREQNLINSDNSEEDEDNNEEIQEVEDECIEPDLEGTVTYQVND